MARIEIIHDVRDLSAVEIHKDVSGALIDWLETRFPQGFDLPCGVFVNSRLTGPDQFGVELKDTDRVRIQFAPAGAEILVGAIIVAAVATSVALTFLLTPKPPTAVKEGAAGSVYSVTAQANQAKLGGVVPFVAGTFERTPEYASQSYREFVNNQEVRYFLLALGCGDLNVLGIKIGETSVSDLPSGLVDFEAFKPAQHESTLGVIDAAFGMHENVVTSTEVDSREIDPITRIETTINGTTSGGDTFTFTDDFGSSAIRPGDVMIVYDPALVSGTYTVDSVTDTTIVIVEGGLGVVTDENIFFRINAGTAAIAGPFPANPPGTLTQLLEFDIEWPGGVYKTKDNGSFQNLTVAFRATVQEIDDDGDAVGSPTTHNFTFTGATNTPQRRTYQITKAAGRYTVQMQRTDDQELLARDSSRTIWTGLRAYLDYDTEQVVYGDVTLLALKIIGAEALSASSQSQIRVKTISVLPSVDDLIEEGSPAPVPAETANPADLMAAVYTSQTFGARRPIGELDGDALSAFRADQVGRSGFNGVFDTRTTIWEALEAIANVGRAKPSPEGNTLSVIVDEARATRASIVTPDVILRDSLKLTFDWRREGDNDGLRVAYRDPVTFVEKAAVFPVDSLDPQDVPGFGLTDETEAEGAAEYLWRDRTLRNARYEFATEYDALNFRLYDRVGLVVPWLNWGDGYRVVSASGLNVTLNRPAPDGVIYVAFRDEDGTASAVQSATGDGSNVIVLDDAAPFAFVTNGRQQPTFAALGLSEDFMHDVTITRIMPKARSVSVEAVRYVPTLWDDLP